MGKPLISVLMPVFNAQRYLQAALDSVLAQTFRDFELVVVDDGSTDETPLILSRCCDPRVQLTRMDHVGLVGALNAGMARCTAPYIARMDADDLSYPERFGRELEYLTGDAGIDVVTCWSDLIDESGQIIGRRAAGVSDDMLLELAAGNQIVHGSVMLRRESLPPSPVYPQAPEDYWLWAGLARAGKRFYCVPEVHYAFRTHGERYSLTHAGSQSAGIMDLQWTLLEECSSNRDSRDPAVRVRLVRGWGGVAGAAYRSGNTCRGDIARKRFLELAGDDWGGEMAAAVHYGIEAMSWGGCPWHQQWGLRWLEWKNRPSAWKSYRNLLLTLPPVRRLRTMSRSRE